MFDIHLDSPLTESIDFRDVSHVLEELAGSGILWSTLIERLPELDTDSLLDSICSIGDDFDYANEVLAVIQQFFTTERIKGKSIAKKITSAFSGNKNFIEAGTERFFSIDEIKELARCRVDILYFAEKYIAVQDNRQGGYFRIRLRHWQRKLLKGLADGDRRVLLNASRQQGKTMCISIFILWKLLFCNEGYQIALAAHKQDHTNNILSSILRMAETLPAFMRPSVRAQNKSLLEIESYSAITCYSSSSAGVRGRSVNFAYYDELCFSGTDGGRELYEALLPALGSSFDNSIFILSSTPNGTGDLWFELCNPTEENQGVFKYVHVDFTANPFSLYNSKGVYDSGEAYKAKILKTMGGDLKKFATEQQASFLGSGDSFISADIIERLQSNQVYKIGEKLLVKHKLDIFDYPRPDMGRGSPADYQVVVDCAGGAGRDYTAILVFDFRTFSLVAKYHCNQIKIAEIAPLVLDIARFYNKAWISVENDALGATILGDIYQAGYQYVYQTAGREGQGRYSLGWLNRKNTKAVALAQMLEAFENLPFELDKETITELQNLTVSKSGNKVGAPYGQHDDLAMCVVQLIAVLNCEKHERRLNDRKFNKKRKNIDYDKGSETWCYRKAKLDFLAGYQEQYETACALLAINPLDERAQLDKQNSEYMAKQLILENPWLETGDF
ncbi:hypothetical protein C9E85_14765 [Plesiomonas shigelloides]|uniref:terminase large subunit domain-containing protein n=1 Tax=Plesiomonas shigelloides TaxID=703 RepID=UPI000D5749C2|nr:terminase family protein [Plesiomonas shigelloides]PVU65093.1 hypothetical protein C9E85_14765 [Plesiomonas shigelloides]